jgi:hypothetical protein
VRYFLYVKQLGGCDYTIGCGRRLIDLGTGDEAEAKNRIYPKLQEMGWGPVGESDITLESATLLAVSETAEVNLEQMLHEHQIIADAIEKAEQHRQDVEEFNHLKQKLGL